MNQSRELRCQISVHLDTAKVVGKFRQQGRGHGSRNRRKESVTTHLPNLPVLKMDGAKTNGLNSAVWARAKYIEAQTCRTAWGKRRRMRGNPLPSNL